MWCSPRSPARSLVWPNQTSRGPLWKGLSQVSPSGRGAGRSDLELPAPSLIGNPVDEAGYQAVRAGYAPLIVGGGIAEIVGWRCCEKIVFFHALLDKQLSRLGIKPWPLTPSDYEDILQGSIHDVTSLHWVYLQRSYNNVTPQIQQIVYSIVDLILASNPEHSPASLQRLLLRYETYRPWLFNALPFHKSRASQGNYGRWIQKEWIHYADRQLEAAAAPGKAMPEQDLHLLCTDERFNGAHLYRYDLQRDEFIEENSAGPFRRMYPLPGRRRRSASEIGRRGNRFPDTDLAAGAHAGRHLRCRQCRPLPGGDLCRQDAPLYI